MGDEVHLVTPEHLEVIYRGQGDGDSIVIGRIASSAGLPGRLQLSTLVSRHCSIIGSTGAGKSNLVATVLEELSSGSTPAHSRTLVIDAHGEYATAVGERGRVIHTGATVPERCQGSSSTVLGAPFQRALGPC